jgi:solute carrier family 25 protein 16
MFCKGQGSLSHSPPESHTLFLLPQSLSMSVRTINVNKEDSQKLDLIIRNGLAGGVAGCAVSLITLLCMRQQLLMRGSCRPKRSSPRWRGSRLSSKPLILTLCTIPPTRTVSSEQPETSKRRMAYRRFSKATRPAWSASSLMLASTFLRMNRAVMVVSPETEIPLRRFLCGSIAGATSTFVTYPLDLIRTRLAFETGRGYYSSWLGICRKIYHEESRGSSWGVANFCRGFAPTMLGILPYAGMSFLTHDVVKDWFGSPALAPTPSAHSLPLD